MTDNKDDKSLINTGADNDITNIETIKDKVDRFGQKIIALYIERKLTIAEIAFKLFGSVSGYIRQAISDYLTAKGIPIESPTRRAKRIQADLASQVSQDTLEISAMGLQRIKQKFNDPKFCLKPGELTQMMTQFGIASEKLEQWERHEDEFVMTIDRELYEQGGLDILLGKDDGRVQDDGRVLDDDSEAEK